MVQHFKNYDHMFEGFYHDEVLAKDDWKVIEADQIQEEGEGEEEEEDMEETESNQVN